MLSTWPVDLDGFVGSGLTTAGQFLSVAKLLEWYDSRCRVNRSKVERIPFEAAAQWSFTPSPRRIIHDSGKFFSVVGQRVTNAVGDTWDQPILDQPEVGLLGMVTAVFGGVRYFLVQAKMEPGNINGVQLSPTVQATQSNYTRAHHGSLPSYIEYFQGAPGTTVLVDQVRLEQGGHFLYKRNRNLVVHVEGDVPMRDAFCWLTLGQIRQLLHLDNLVHMDTRSVISCLPYLGLAVPNHARREDRGLGQGNDSPLTGVGEDLTASLQADGFTRHNSGNVLDWLERRRTAQRLVVRTLGLDRLRGWVCDSAGVHHQGESSFSVIAVGVTNADREVSSWSQPILARRSVGIFGLLAQRHNDRLHFLVRAVSEPGTAELVSIAPTVVWPDTNPECSNPSTTPFLDAFREAAPGQILLSVILSDEGGRYFKFQYRYMVVELPANTVQDLPPDFSWLTLRQLMEPPVDGRLTIEARNLLACLSSLWVDKPLPKRGPSEPRTRWPEEGRSPRPARAFHEPLVTPALKPPGPGQS